VRLAHAIPSQAATLLRQERRTRGSNRCFPRPRYRSVAEMPALHIASLPPDIIARETGHQRTIRPIVEDPADIFPRDACHRGEVALRNLLLNEDASLADVTAKRFGEAQ
jgi:hypothetical protein